MDKKFMFGFFSAILFLGIVGGVIAIGFHQASEILPGTFSGNFNFINGNVGIGTISPIAKINVKSDTNQAVQFDINTVNGPGGSASISLRNYNDSLGNSNGIIGYNSAGAMVAWIDLININHNAHGTQSGAISFSTENNGIQNQRMRITSEGNVGIGTTSPIAKLSVVGNITAEAICDETGNNCKDISTGWSSSSDWTCGDGSNKWPSGASTSTIYDLELCKMWCESNSYQYCSLQGPYGAGYACAGGNSGWMVNGVDTCWIDLS